MGVDSNLAMLEQERKVEPWHKVAEFSLNLNDVQNSTMLKAAWEELAQACPSYLWTERLRTSLQNTLADSLQRMGQDLVFTVTFVISCLSPAVHFSPASAVGADLSTTPHRQPATGGESWGFFVIDRPDASLHAASPLAHTIEIYFYCE